MCIPKDYACGNDVVIPRGQTRATLASGGLAGKIRLNSGMTEEEFFSEFRSVFLKNHEKLYINMYTRLLLLL